MTVRNLSDAVDQLKRLGKPFLDWAGKAERLSFDVPTLPLFIHERLSTTGIIETLKGHRRDRNSEQLDMFELFGDPQHSVRDQVLKAYEYREKWVNRMVLGDSLLVMNSLLRYEGLGGHVQMIYMDPPFPRTSAWENLKKALRATYEESVWDHLAGSRSAPFEQGEHGQVAVKVIDDWGNELLVVKKLDEAQG